MRKATISFVMSVCLSIRMEQLGSYWTDFDESWYMNFFRKSVEEIQLPLKSDKNNGYFTWRRFHIYNNISLNSSYNEKRLRQICRENKNIYFTFNNVFSRRSCRLWDNVEKCGGAREATNYVTTWRIQVACWISKATRTHARVHTQIYNTYCSSRQQLFANAPQCYAIQHVHCLCC